MNNVKQLLNTLNAAHAYEKKHNDPVGVLKILLRDFQACNGCAEDHEPEDCLNYERDWDLEAKDAELVM